MASKSTGSTAISGSLRSWSEPQRMVLAILWLVTAAAMGMMLWQDVRHTNQFSTARHALLVAYAAALLWYLGRSGPSVSLLPEVRPFVFPRWRDGAWIPVLGITLTFVLAVLSGAFQSIMLLSALVASIWIIVVWRWQASLRSVVQGVGLAAFALAVCLLLLKNGLISPRAAYLLTPLAAPMYVAGGLLFNRTGLGGIRLLAKQYLPALRSFFQGCLLFVPLGLANAASGSPGSGLTWVTEWWMPLWLPWWSGLVEETWFRLLLVGLVYWMLRPAFPERPALAILAAVLFSGIAFGLSHGLSVDTFLTTGLLFGVPFAAVFARRDWEHAVGAHYMVNLIPWVMVFLEAR
jgi:hypothetical protein